MKRLNRFARWGLALAGVVLLATPAVAGLRPANVWTKSTNLTGSGVACTTSGGASCTAILNGTDVVGWENLAITIKNTDGADALTNVNVLWSPGPDCSTVAANTYEVWDTTTFAALAAGATKTMQLSGNSRRCLKIEARSANDASADVTVTGN